MSSDRTRNSHDPRQKYESLVFQAGRVLVDPDLTEAQDLLDGTIDANTLDIIGPYGTHDDGYEIHNPTYSGTTSTFDINAGTMYVGGERLTREHDVGYFWQNAADWVTVPLTIADPAGKIEHVHLHVMEQEVGAVEDQALKEVALGGPDTSNRKRLVQRVNRLTVDSAKCDQGWRRVQDHYIEQGYNFDLAFDPDEPNKPLIDPRTMLLVPNAHLQVGFTNDEILDKPCEPEAHGGYLGADNQMIRVKVVEHVAGSSKAKILWSFDNASHMYRVEVGADNKTLTLSEQPVDTFHWPKSGQAVEILRTGVRLENGQYVAEHLDSFGILNSDFNIEEQIVTLVDTVDVTKFPVGQTEPPIFMRVWQELIEIDVTDPPSEVTLGTTGITVKIGRNVDTSPLPEGVFWTFAVRPTTPNEVYPHRYKDAAQPPEGPRQWIAPLATINWSDTANPVPHDCRGKFVPLTDVLAMYFIEGESQQVMPTPLPPGSFLSLPVRPKVGVSRGINPEAGARVKFTITTGAGQIVGADEVTTGADGIAECNWEVDATNNVQHLTAELLDEDDSTTHIPLVFTVQLSRAELVAYNPNCSRFAGSVTVQDAIDDLCVIPAGTVTYDPSNCSHVTGNNVQDAIDELCKRESSEGCCTVVEPGRNNLFEALKLILEELSKEPLGNKPVNGVCLCLLPGVHVWTRETTKVCAKLPRPLSLHIHGIRGASFLTSNEEIEIRELVALDLRDLNITARGTEHAIMVERCEELNIEGCDISGIVKVYNLQNEGPGVPVHGAVLRLASVSVLHMSDNTLSGSILRTVPGKPTEVVSDRGAIAVIPMAKVRTKDRLVQFMTDSKNLDARLSQLKKHLPRIIEERADAVVHLERFVSVPRSLDDDAIGHVKFLIEELLLDKPRKTRLTKRILDLSRWIFALNRSTPVVLQIEDLKEAGSTRGAQVSHKIERNVLNGWVSLYGPAPITARTRVIQNAARKGVKEGVQQKVMYKEWGLARLFFSENMLMGFRLAALLSIGVGERLEQTLNSKSLPPFDLYQVASLEGNDYQVGMVEFLSAHTTLTASFFTNRSTKQGAIIGRAATASSNIADSPETIIDAITLIPAKESANVQLSF